MKQMTQALKLAGAAALAGSTQSYGQIINLTLPTNLTGVSPGSNLEYYSILAGTTSTSPGGDFAFKVFNSGSGSSAYLQTSFSTVTATTGVAGFSVIGYYGTYNIPSSLAVGAKVGTGSTDTPTFLNSPGSQLILANPYGGPLPANTVEYVGFQFAIGSSLHDGWLELDSVPYTSSSSPGGLLFIGGAYNGTADNGSGGGNILVGETAVAPEPSTLSALVLGAAALGTIGLARRRRSSPLASNN